MSLILVLVILAVLLQCACLFQHKEHYGYVDYSKVAQQTIQLKKDGDACKGGVECVSGYCSGGKCALNALETRFKALCDACKANQMKIQGNTQKCKETCGRFY